MKPHSVMRWRSRWERSMSTDRLRKAVAMVLLVLGLAAGVIRPAQADGPLAGYNAAIGESSISGISSGAFMAVQFATAWSSLIKGVGIVAGGPYWCAKADADDIMNGFSLPIMNATGPCMAGPPTELGSSFAKADAKAASGEIDPLRFVSRQK